MAANGNPAAERLIFGLMSAFFVAYGWLDLLEGGIAMKGRRGDVSFVDGTAGLLVAFGAFLLATLLSLLLVKSCGGSKRVAASIAASILLPPLLLVLFR